MIYMRWAFFFLLFSSLLAAESLGLDPAACQLFEDLKTVECVDKKIHDTLPLLLNYQLQGGYFMMPSARTFHAGVIGLGYAYVVPYNIWSLAFNFFDHLETTGNYWVYTRFLEGVLGHKGFGDYAKRAVNVKLVLHRLEDGFPYLPELALGVDDFLNERFGAFYAVATQQFLDYNLEASLGVGSGRIHGLYGALAWSPLHHTENFFKGLSLVAEYDATNYKHHWSRKDNQVRSRINAGVQLDLWDLIHLEASTLKGTDLTGSVAFHYDLGNTDGFLPKIFDTCTYTEPEDVDPIGTIRTKEELAHEIALAFKTQGFDLYNLYLVPGGRDQLWMKVVNVHYREEEEVRKRIEHILAYLAPQNISDYTVVIEADGVAEHEYRFRYSDLARYREERLGETEFEIIAPLRETSSTPSIYDAAKLYQRHKPIWLFTFRPWIRNFFGTSRGKFKYELGVSGGPEGYLFDSIYYSLWASYTAIASEQNIQTFDYVNPSRIINVRTDSLKYNQSSSFHLDLAYLQKSFNWGKGWFSRLAVGYFETAYAGIALENLYYPVNSSWAIGFEGAGVLKREYYGIGFQKKIRKWTVKGIKHFPYKGLQYFLDLYYQYKPLSLDFKIQAGQFLARDKGVRIEGGRTFQSGLRVGLWYTLTTANDVVNGERYYDKGFSISLPLDMFLFQSSRSRLSYSMSGMLRDCGAIAQTGKPLYPTLFWERYNYQM